MNTVSAPTPATRSYKGASIEERRHQRRERLIDAALEAFARRGISKTTIRDICSEARLTERYFYESFKSTEEAFDAVYLHLKCQLVARVTEALSHAPRSVEQLASGGLRAFYVFLREDPRRAQIMLIDAYTANQSSLEKSKKAVREYIEMVRQLAAALYPDLYKKLDFEMLAGGLLGMAIQVGMVWARSNYAQPIEEVLGYNLYAWQGLEARLRDMATHHEKLSEKQSEKNEARKKAVAIKRKAA